MARGCNLRIHDYNETHIPKEDKKEIETKVVVSQIPPMYLDNSVNQCLGSVEPFLLSIFINGKTLKNCIIDSWASNTTISFEIMKGLGLKVDIT